MNKSITPQSMLNVHVVQKVEMRRDLIRQKTAMRAAGYEPVDPSILQMKNNVPAVAGTAVKSAGGAVDLGRTSVTRFAPMTATTLGAAAAFREVSAPEQSTFARNSSFSSTWKVKPRA